MKQWRARVDVSDVFHDDEVTLGDKAQTIAARLGVVGERIDPGSDELPELLEELCDAGAQGDVQWFDNVWSGVYDWADANRVWVSTR
jgi:hypothetical protein